MQELITEHMKAYQIRDYLRQPPELGRYATLYGNNREAGCTIAAADGTRLYFEVYGNDPSRPWAVCVHTVILGYPADFTSEIDRLRETHNVIVPMLRGHGASQLGANPITTKLLCVDLLSILGALTDGPADFVFSAQGSAVGFCLAAEHSEKIRHIAFYAGCACRPYPEFIDVAFEKLVAIDPPYFSFLQSHYGEAATRAMVRAYGQWIAQEIYADRSVFSRIHAPTLIAAPDRDPFIPLSTCIEAYRYIRGARLVVWPGDMVFDADTSEYVSERISLFFTDRL